MYTGPATAHKITRLRPGQSYKLRLQCSDVRGVSEPSHPVTLTTAASVPGTPQAPAVLATTADSATLRWTCPPGHGEPVTSYVLEGDYGDGGPMHLVYNGPAEECCVTRLEVCFAVQMLTNLCMPHVCTLLYPLLTMLLIPSIPVSPSPHSRPRRTGFASPHATRWVCLCGARSSRRPRTQPPLSPPLRCVSCSSTAPSWSLRGTHRSGTLPQVCRKMIAPCIRGIAAVPPPTHTAYELELKAASQAALQAGWPEDYCSAYKGASPCCTVGGLRAGCAYTARVRVVDKPSAAALVWSQPLDTATAPDAPEQPDAPWMCGSSAATLQLAWQAPVHDGGAPLTAYRVQLRTRGNDAEPAQVYDGVDTHCTVQELLPGVDYEFRLQAVNAQGASTWSDWGLGATRPAPPPAPVLLLSACSATTAEVCWTDACAGATFHVQMASLGGQPSRAGSSADIRVLSDASGDAVSSVSDSSGEHLLQPVTPPNGPPGPPPVQSPARSPSRHSIAEEEGGMLFTTAYTGSATRCTLTGGCALNIREILVLTPLEEHADCHHDTCDTGLQPGSQCFVRVKASNAHGSSPWSAVLALTTAPAPPGPPAPPSASPQPDGSIDLHWRGPTAHHGCPPKSFEVEVAAAPGRGRTPATKWARCFQGEATHCSVTGLAPGQRHVFRVRAANSCGWGQWSPVATAATPAVCPGPPSLPWWGVKGGVVRVQWQGPEDDGGACISNYRCVTEACACSMRG